MNINTLDLNLLRLFDAIWRTRNVSRAAEQLGLSQPAASQAAAKTTSPFLNHARSVFIFISSSGFLGSSPRRRAIQRALRHARRSAGANFSMA